MSAPATIGGKLQKPEWRRVLNSVLPGQTNWASYVERDGDCKPSCPNYRGCKGFGPDDVCTSEWGDAPVSESTLGVVLHVLNSFDYYNRRDLKDLRSQSKSVVELREEVTELLQEATVGVTEGFPGLRSHLATERGSSALARKLKERAADSGRVICEGCGVNYFKRLGAASTSLIDLHHKRPLGKSKGKRKTGPDDLLMVCANCHRMLHSPGIELDLKKLQALMQ